jgi:methionine biosynthesis protein MetW
MLVSTDMWPRVRVACELIKNIMRDPPHRLLDLGCNNGTFTIIVAKSVGASEIYGIDIDKEVVNEARKRGVVAYTLDLNSNKLPFKDDYFDLIIMFEVIEHLVNPDNALREARRVLKPSGFFVLTTPNLASWLNRILLLLGYQPTYLDVSTETSVGHFHRGEPLGHVRGFTLRALKGLLEYHGFKIVKVAGSGSLHQPNIIKFLDRLFAYIPSLARILVIVCQK